MSYLIINAAMVPNEGTFSYSLISREDASAWLYQHFAHDDVIPISYVGYEQTARHLEALFPSFIKIPLNRAKCSMQPGGPIAIEHS